MHVIVGLRDLLLEIIGDLYSAELQQLRMLPILHDKVSSHELKEMIHRLTNETTEHVVRLDRILTSMHEQVNGDVCLGVQVLIERTFGICAKCVGTHVMDSAVIASVQQIIHYEVAGYGVACAFANSLNAHELAYLLYETLQEVRVVDKCLSDLAIEKVNVQANITMQENSDVRNLLGVSFDRY